MTAMLLSARVLTRFAARAFPALAVAVGVVTAGSALAQPPRDPALLVPQVAPLLDYVPVPDPLSLPAGVEMGASTDVAFDSRGHLYVLTRGTAPVMEFDEEGRLVRAFGEGLFSRTHGLHIDADDNIWVTDVREQIVVKFSAAGEMLMTLGTRGESGAWDEAAGSRRFSEPNDLVVAGNVLAAMGRPGTNPGEFGEAHYIAVSPRGELYVSDTVNRAVQKFMPRRD